MNSLHILLSQSITHTSLKAADGMLSGFVTGFVPLYGKQYMYVIVVKALITTVFPVYGHYCR